MAKASVCSIPECGKPVDAHGWCHSHYMRWRRHGDPLGGGTARGEPEQFLQNVVLPYEGDECLIWPFNRASDGYGRIVRDGRNVVVARVVCEEVHGFPPGSEYETAHSCANGGGGCVNKRHLSWKTRAGNAADTVAHGNSTRGTRNARAKLTEQQVLEIRSLAGALSAPATAKMFGVSIQTIHEIRQRRTWGWL